MSAGCTPVAAVDTPVAAVASCLDWNALHCSRHVPFVVAVVVVDLAAFDGDGLNSQRSYSSVDSEVAAAAVAAAAAVVVGNSYLY